MEPKPKENQPGGSDLELAIEAERLAREAEEQRTGRREHTLTSGVKVQVLTHGKGKHLRQASRIAGPGTDQMTFSMAMVAVKALVEGKAVTLEDLLEMDDNDVLEMIGIVMGGKAKGT